jgi:hypothetical protein
MTALLQAIFAGIRSRVDHSYTITFITRELSGSDAASLLDMQQQEVTLSISQDDQSAEAPAYKPTNPARTKSPSQRVRQEMWAYWNEAHRTSDVVVPDSFEEFYESEQDTYIRYWHDKRVGLQS